MKGRYKTRYDTTSKRGQKEGKYSFSDSDSDSYMKKEGEDTYRRRRREEMKKEQEEIRELQYVQYKGLKQKNKNN